MLPVVLAPDRNPFPGNTVGERHEIVHFVTPCMIILVAAFFLYGAYVFRSPLRLTTLKKQVDIRKAWALFLKFDRRGQLRLDYDDMTCFMSIVCPDGKSMREWNIGFYKQICNYIDSDCSEGLPFFGFLHIYKEKIGDIEEHYKQVFEAERSELAKYVLNEDPVENITAVHFATIDTQLQGKLTLHQFETCFQACCANIGIPEPHEEWYPLAFTNFGGDGDGFITYSSFHRTVQQYRDHCRAVKANLEAV